LIAEKRSFALSGICYTLCVAKNGVDAVVENWNKDTTS